MFAEDKKAEVMKIVRRRHPSVSDFPDPQILEHLEDIMDNETAAEIGKRVNPGHTLASTENKSNQWSPDSTSAVTISI